MLATARGQGIVRKIEAQFSLARRFIGPVALETVLGKDRPNFPQVTDRAASGARHPTRVSAPRASCRGMKPGANARIATTKRARTELHLKLMNNRILNSTRGKSPACQRRVIPCYMVTVAKIHGKQRYRTIHPFALAGRARNDESFWNSS